MRHSLGTTALELSKSWELKYLSNIHGAFLSSIYGFKDWVLEMHVSKATLISFPRKSVNCNVSAKSHDWRKPPMEALCP